MPALFGFKMVYFKKWDCLYLEKIELSVYSDGSNQFPSWEGIRGVLKLVIERNCNTPPSPSQEGSQVQPVNNRIVRTWQYLSLLHFFFRTNERKVISLSKFSFRNSPPFLFMWGIFPLIVGNNPHCNGEKHPLLWWVCYSSAISIGIDDW